MMNKDHEINQQAVAHQYRDSSNLDARIRLHCRFSTNHYGWFSWYLDHLELPTGTCLLELGCGPASLWRDNLHRIGPGWTITLSDASLGMVREARTNTASGVRLRYASLDAQVLPFPDHSFDAVLANHMLYHVSDLPRALAEIRRVLRPGGRLYAATNGENHMKGLNALVQRLAPQFTYRDNQSKVSLWLRRFNLENGAGLLRPYFSQIRLERYIDGLEVTEAQALVDYVLSMSSAVRQTADPAAIQHFHDDLQAEIQAHGAIHIPKDTGLFIADNQNRQA